MVSNTTFLLKERYKLCDFTYALKFQPEPGFSYKPGQHISITIIKPVYTDDEGNSRYYSIANAPSFNEDILIVMRESNSAFNKNIFLLNEGDKISVKGPQGNLAIHENKEIPAVFIAGGLGITPFRSIIEEELKLGKKREIYLFYSNQTESSSAFLQEFTEWAKLYSNFHFYPLINDVNNKEWKYDYGLIDEQVIKKYLKDTGRNIFYIAGPPPMVEFVKDELLKTGAAPENILWDKF